MNYDIMHTARISLRGLFVEFRSSQVILKRSAKKIILLEEDNGIKYAYTVQSCFSAL